MVLNKETILGVFEIADDMYSGLMYKQNNIQSVELLFTYSNLQCRNSYTINSDCFMFEQELVL